MKFWIEKEHDSKPTSGWDNAYIFSLTQNGYSTIFSSIKDIWYWMDCMSITPIYEDLFLIGISVFALDKRIERRKFIDCWTREISVSIPVLEYDKWENTQKQWNYLLRFLTGDVWDIQFRRTDKVYSKREHPNRKHLNVKGCDCVSLFSGGLDSYCGAIKLLEDGKSPCLVGHNEYPKLAKIQDNFAKTFRKLYPEQKVEFIGFSANSRAPRNFEGMKLEGAENTSRGRSLLFLCAAITIAGILDDEMSVYIPENGFIGLNLPLTNGRKGTCSTRTTHPYFLHGFQTILKGVGIKNEINNFFAYLTKREIVEMVKNSEAFAAHYEETISCSHPCLPRYYSKSYPVNCGYCYPCLIRKSSLIDSPDSRYSYDIDSTFLQKYGEAYKASDLRAVISAVYNNKQMSDDQIREKIKYTGQLDKKSVEKFLRVYKSTMNDLEEMFIKDKDIAKLIGD